MDKANDPQFYTLLASSFARLLGKPLVTDLAVRNSTVGAQALWLYKSAPFCVLAHDTQADPIFTYANRAAQQCFGYDWAEFTRLPSRLSAEAPDRAERQRLLNHVTNAGYLEHYRGLRIAKSGRQFWIENAVVWQLIDETGTLHGQAAMFKSPQAAET